MTERLNKGTTRKIELNTEFSLFVPLSGYKGTAGDMAYISEPAPRLRCFWVCDFSPQ